MITQYNYKEFYSSLGSHKLLLQCEFCKNTFYVTKKRIQEALKGKGRTKCNFCSKSCASKSKKKLIELTCTMCNKTFFREKTNIKTNKNGYFCSIKCSSKYFKNIQ